ncbi:MAG: hypothetical protein BGP06_02020 [Rhizobiales bacterium 65-9]|nr:ABC transporter substrate-binding protein [Hyphomicrobiales bacterium]OJY34263.1 MAG: hypothetical protein BGP06_02020 [Rhizobiales bacterium 65-9]
MRRFRPGISVLASSLLSLAAAVGLFAQPSSTPWSGALAARAQTPAPGRIVALGGVVTEILYAVGAQDRIVGLDTTSLYPPGAMKDKPNVGYVRALSAEGVLSLNPSLVIAIDGAGPPDAMKLIEESGINVVHVPEEFTADGIADRIRKVAALGGAPARGETIAAETAAKFRALETARSRIKTPKRILFALSLQNGRVMAGGGNTSADAIIKLAGAVNAVQGFDGYKPMTDESVIAAAPDFILVMNRGDHAASADQVFAMPAFAPTPAARGRSFASMDGLYLLGFGPRTPDAAGDLMRAVYGADVAKP